MGDRAEQAGLKRGTDEAAIAGREGKAKRIAFDSALIRLSRSSDSGSAIQVRELVMPFVCQICVSDERREMNEGHHVSSTRLAPCGTLLRRHPCGPAIRSAQCHCRRADG